MRSMRAEIFSRRFAKNISRDCHVRKRRPLLDFDFQQSFPVEIAKRVGAVKLTLGGLFWFCRVRARVPLQCSTREKSGKKGISCNVLDKGSVFKPRDFGDPSVPHKGMPTRDESRQEIGISRLWCFTHKEE